jgi:hypothetical protein
MFKLADPLTPNVPALAEIETSEADNAVKPIFLRLFILITPLFLIVIINNKR